MSSFFKFTRFLFGKLSKLQILVILAIIVFAFIISDSSIFARFSYDAEIRDLKSQIEHYKVKTEEDRRKLNELRSSKENIEKFARENYLMKKENEEIFIIE